MGFAYFTTANFLLTFVAASLCVCFAPTAAGPGIPEIKAYLNGIDTPNMFGATTLIVKVRMPHTFLLNLSTRNTVDQVIFGLSLSLYIVISAFASN